MFIFQLMGGLGNQMFQYAAARSLSLKRDIPFKVIFNDPYKYVTRKYNLDFFDIDVSFANKAELRNTQPTHGLKRKLLQLTGYDPDNKLFQEKTYYRFDPNLFTAIDGTYFRGFWQSYKYFENYREQLLKDFSFKYEIDELNKEYLQQIEACNSVSVHIRRGDYVNVSQTQQAHGICSLEYYENAFRFFINRLNNPVFFIFSDDKNWVKENLRFDCPMIFITGNQEDKSYEDLRLMRSCNHHIIANSSFSWWGAWLGISPDKIVVCPSKWTSSHLSNEIDIIPKDWNII